MIIDVTGIELKPGNDGVDCLGNGKHIDKNGDYIECCCDECDYMLCCLKTHQEQICKTCTDNQCPHSTKETFEKRK